MDYITDSEKMFQKDMKYIKNDIIAIQANGLLCKFSKPLSTLTIWDLPKEKYKKYWIDQYRTKGNEKRRKIIEQLVDEKLESGLTSLTEMIDLQTKSKYTSETAELIRIITDKRLPEQRKAEKENKTNAKTKTDTVCAS